jgi:DNA-binding MarR family transcriptional regulator
LLACTYWLGEHGELPNQLAVARQAGTDVKMTSQVLARLEQKGLIERRTHATDTRAKVVGVTPRGRSLALKAIDRVEDADAAFFAECPASLVGALRRSGRPDQVD